MNLNFRSTAKRGGQTYSISAAARALGCSIYLLRKLEAEGIIAPDRANDTVGSRLYTDADLHKVLAFYAARGGIRDAVAIKREKSDAIRREAARAVARRKS